jgi:hypothetical protein
VTEKPTSEDCPTNRTRRTRADGSRPTAGLHRQKAATQKATLRGNPVEHGNIGVIESGGQARYCAIGLRYHDLRMRDHRGDSFDGWATARDQRQFIDSMGPASFSVALVGGTKRLDSRCPGDGELATFFRVRLSFFWHNCTLGYGARGSHTCGVPQNNDGRTCARPSHSQCCYPRREPRSDRPIDVSPGSGFDIQSDLLSVIPHVQKNCP